MSAKPLRASASAPGCPSASPVNTSAACILVTILAANLAATRTEASLPYLVQGAPLALRFADPKPALPPLPKRYAANGASPAQGNAADSSAPPDPQGTAGPTNSSSDPRTPEIPVVAANYETPPLTPTPATSKPAGASTPTGSPTTVISQDEGVSIIPDTYAPKSIISIDDLLPFFTPPAAPPSRARYELK